jgi:hypothetical protein
MRHLLPELELNQAACLLDAFGQPETVVAKNFMSANLDQDWW